MGCVYCLLRVCSAELLSLYCPFPPPQVDGGLGLLWLAAWVLLGREVPHREGLIPLTSNEAAAGHQQGGGGGGGGAGVYCWV